MFPGSGRKHSLGKCLERQIFPVTLFFIISHHFCSVAESDVFKTQGCFNLLRLIEMFTILLSFQCKLEFQSCLSGKTISVKCDGQCPCLPGQEFSKPSHNTEKAGKYRASMADFHLVREISRSVNQFRICLLSLHVI